MAKAPGRDERAMRNFVEHMARTLADWGLPRMAGRVLFAMMGADERALTAGELGERLGVSPAAISGAVRFLIQINMVVREPVPGSRRDRYRLLDDSWYEVTLAKMTLLRSLADLAEQGVAAAGGPDTPAGERLTNMRDFYLFLQDAMPGLMAEWAARKDGSRRTVA
jgi:DNA-binding MarR family transcriptional regulator